MNFQIAAVSVENQVIPIDRQPQRTKLPALFFEPDVDHHFVVRHVIGPDRDLVARTSFCRWSAGDFHHGIAFKIERFDFDMSTIPSDRNSYSLITFEIPRPLVSIAIGPHSSFCFQPIDRRRNRAGVFFVVTSRRRQCITCLLYTSPSPRDGLLSRMPSSA